MQEPVPDEARTTPIVIPDPEQVKRDRRRAKYRRWIRGIAEFPILVLIAFIIAIGIKSFLVQAFFIPSGSMKPTLQVGDRVLVEKISYRLKDPAREDIVVFAKEVFGYVPPDVPWHEDLRNYLRELAGLPTGVEEDYIKRIVATAGDTVRYVGKPRRLYVNDEEVPQGYVKGGADRFSSTITPADCQRLKMERVGKNCRVPAGRVFVMGDNRANSEDSRILGPIDEDKIVGRAFVIIWPFEDWQLL